MYKINSCSDNLDFHYVPEKIDTFLIQDSHRVYANRNRSLIKADRIYLQTEQIINAQWHIKGDKDKANKNLRIFNQIQSAVLLMATGMKTDPLFNRIMNEPEFQQIARDIEAKYQAEHERVRKWLEETGQL